MSKNRLSEEVLFETKVHCLYLLDQFNKAPNTEERIRKHQLNDDYKNKIMDANMLDEIKTKLLEFKTAIGTKNEGLLYQKVEECLNIPSILALTTEQGEARRVYPRTDDPNYYIKLKCCVPLLEYSLSHPEHPIKDLINTIRTAESIDFILSAIDNFKSEHVKPRSILGSIFSRDSLSQHLDKSSEIVDRLKQPDLRDQISL